MVSIINNYEWLASKDFKAILAFQTENRGVLSTLLFDSPRDPNRWVLFSKFLPCGRKTLPNVQNKFEAISEATNILQNL